MTHPAANVWDAAPKKVAKGGPKNDLELQSQCNLFTWARNPAVQSMYPGIDVLSSSLNGVKLSKAQAGKAKGAGMLAGEHDIRLPVARGGYVGLTIEMKAGTNGMTAKQKWYRDRMIEEGHLVAACWDWLDAKHLIVAYLTAPPTGTVGERADFSSNTNATLYR